MPGFFFFFFFGKTRAEGNRCRTKSKVICRSCGKFLYGGITMGNAKKKDVK
jgi:hypothetical protein